MKQTSNAQRPTLTAQLGILLVIVLRRRDAFANARDGRAPRTLTADV